MECKKRWRNAYNESGDFGLRDSRRLRSGRPLKRELTVEEIIAKKDAEIAYWKAEAELLKKIELQERKVKNSKLSASSIFVIIRHIILKYNYKNMVSHLCEVALVSRSGYYNYLKSTDRRNRRDENDLELKDIILKAFNHRGYKKGSRSIKMALQNEFDLIINRKCIQRIMRKYNIECPIRKANPYRRMMKATREHTVVPNILNRKFKQYLVGKVLLTDITYLTYGASKRAYLSTIKDAFIHSDQGVHYTIPRFQKLLKKYKIGQSMSRRGNCWDNAPQESFFGHMKDEIDLKGCSTFAEIEASTDNYMDYYNNYRYQWGLKKLAPVQYRNQLIAA